MQSDSKAYSASCAIHFGLGGILLFSSLHSIEKPDETKEVFELFSAPIPADPNARQVTSPHDAPPMPKNFIFNKIKEVPIKFPEPEPEEPASPAQPSRVPDKTTAKNPDKSTPKDPSKVGKKPLTYGEFAQSNPAPAPSTPKSGKTAKSQPAPQVFIPGSLNGKTMATPLTGPLSIPVDPAEENLYVSQLVQRIKQAWRKPPSYSLLECKVGFDVSAFGSLTNITLMKSSGDSSFDQSAMDALKAVGAVGKPPGGKALVGYYINFNLKD